MNVGKERTQSLWMDTAVAEGPSLHGKDTADVVVVGSGIAGLSTAYELANRGRKVIVVDRGEIGMGMTARTTAHLASALDDGYAELTAARGLEAAQCVYQAQTAAIDRIEAVQTKESIDCDFRRVDGYLMLEPETSEKDFEEELKACQDAGVAVEETVQPTPLHSSDQVRSLRFRNQARFHPLKYLAGLTRSIKQNGGRLLANTAVSTVSEEKASVLVETDKGTIRAADVVIATNSPIAGDVAIHTKQGPYRTYAIAADIPRGSLPDALYWDTLDPYHYVRLQPGNNGQDIVIIGGEDHKSGEADDGEARFAALERWARDRISNLGEVTHRWSGQVMEPSDYIGLAGRNGQDKHRYLATGDSGQGLTNGVIAAVLIADLITEGSSPWAEIFDPDRAMPKTVTEYLNENLTPLKNFGEYLAAGKGHEIEKLKPGEGGVYRSGLKNIAACRDQRGQLHIQSASCTHMGCVVHWNSIEQCWDCPCHGSQFSASGEVLNGPAVSPLEPVEPKEKLTAAE